MTTYKSVDMDIDNNFILLKEEVRNLESVTVLAMENLENELNKYSLDHSNDIIEIFSVQNEGRSLESDIRRVL